MNRSRSVCAASLTVAVIIGGTFLVGGFLTAALIAAIEGGR